MASVSGRLKKTQTCVYSHFTKKLLTQPLHSEHRLAYQVAVLVNSSNSVPWSSVCCGPDEAGMENREGLAAPLILSTNGWVCVFITAQPAKPASAWESRGGQAVSDGSPPLSCCSSFQHSSTPWARFPVFLPTLLQRPREGLTQLLAVSGMLST